MVPPGKTKADETTTIAPLAINGTIDPIRFTLAGGHLAAKQLVIPSVPPEIEIMRKIEHAATAPATRPASRVLTHPMLWWDGKQLRPITPADEAERRASHGVVDAPAK